MSNLYDTSFPEADENPLSQGGVWDVQTTGGQNCQIVSHQVCGSLTGACENNYNAFTPADAQFAETTFGTFTGVAYGDQGPMVRCATGGARTFYQVTGERNVPGNLTELVLRLVGVATLMASESATTWATGDVLYLQADGDQLAVFRNGGANALLRGTDASIPSGRIGLRARESGTMTDSGISRFRGGDLPRSAPGTKTPNLGSLGTMMW